MHVWVLPPLLFGGREAVYRLGVYEGMVFRRAIDSVSLYLWLWCFAVNCQARLWIKSDQPVSLSERQRQRSPTGERMEYRAD